MLGDGAMETHGEADAVTRRSRRLRLSDETRRLAGFDTASLVSIRHFVPTQPKPQPKSLVLRRRTSPVCSSTIELVTFAHRI